MFYTKTDLSKEGMVEVLLQAEAQKNSERLFQFDSSL